MTVKKLAAFYLRYWVGQHDVADNAPAEFRNFVLQQPASRAVIFEALTVLATGRPVNVPPQQQLLAEAALSPSVIAACDVLLASKQYPKTMGTMLRQAYLGEVAAAKSAVLAFLQAEIDKY